MTADMPLMAGVDRPSRASFGPVSPPPGDLGDDGGPPRPQRRSPVESALDRLEGHRRLLLVWHLFWGPRAFGELLRLSERTTRRSLRQELRDLEACGLLRRERCPVDGRRAEYRLTAFGETLKPLLAALYLWGLHVQESRRTGGRRS